MTAPVTTGPRGYTSRRLASIAAATVLVASGCTAPPALRGALGDLGGGSDPVVRSAGERKCDLPAAGHDLVIVCTGLPGGAGWSHEMFRALPAGVDGLDYRDPGPAPVEDEFTWDWNTIVAFPELLDAMSRRGP